MVDHTMSRWKIISSKELFNSGLFKLRSDECELPDKRVMPRYYVLDFPEWVNVVALTSDNQMILVEQYRHAAGEVFLEVPGGSADSRSEDPRVAGLRELREETGYEPGEVIDCGAHFPNPALQSNRMHTYLALDCRKVGEPELDPYEDLQVRLMPLAEALRKWEDGEFTHSIIAASIGRALKHLKARGLA
jgi:8-oxo-dGTP pyrophosphatase MutT (NUDIX family)